MQLNTDAMDMLRVRLEAYGPEVVKRELDNPARRLVLNEEMDQFARAWLDEVTRERRRDRLTRFMMLAAALEFGFTVGPLLGNVIVI